MLRVRVTTISILHFFPTTGRTGTALSLAFHCRNVRRKNRPNATSTRAPGVYALDPEIAPVKTRLATKLAYPPGTPTVMPAIAAASRNLPRPGVSSVCSPIVSPPTITTTCLPPARMSGATSRAAGDAAILMRQELHRRVNASTPAGIGAGHAELRRRSRSAHRIILSNSSRGSIVAG